MGPADEATELTQFSYEHGMSCLGTWSREECLALGRQLQVRDIVCRIVPFVEGGKQKNPMKLDTITPEICNSFRKVLKSCDLANVDGQSLATFTIKTYV